MPQQNLDADSLAERLGSLLSSPALLARAAGCAHATAHLNAARDLADLVCGLGNGNGQQIQDDIGRNKEAAA